MKRMLVVFLGVLLASFTLLSAQDVVAEDVEEVVEAVEEEAEVEMGHDLILGLNGGVMIPVGQNIKDVFGTGIPVSLNAQVPKLANIQDLCVYAGLNLGYFTAAADVGDDMSGIIVAPYGGLDMSKFMPANMKLAVELGVGGYFLTRTDSYAGVGINGAVVAGYDLNDVVENLGVIVKLGGHEILTGPSKDADGTMEWLDVRLGVEYSLPKVLPF
jgi:hypothetical protein